MPVKKYGLGLQKLLTSAYENFLSSRCASAKLIGAVKGESDFLTADHLQGVKEEIYDSRKIRDDTNEAKLEGIVKTLNTFDCRLLPHVKKRVPG